MDEKTPMTAERAHRSADDRGLSAAIRALSFQRKSLPAPHGARQAGASQGQSTLEYAVLVGVIAAALVAMQLYVRRSIQANLKTLENQINAEAM